MESRPAVSDVIAEDAKARNRRVTQVLVDCAGRFGLRAVTEYPVPGGRIDVVWLWKPNEGSEIPGVELELPLVAFEIESSWRTRKHIKGDLMNLQDVRPLVGVIVLLGDGPEVEGTRRFASQLVDRPGARVVVWSEEDVEALVQGRGESAVESEQADVLSVAVAVGGEREHAGKYRPLWSWLRLQETSPVTVTFREIETILGFPLPPSSRRHLPHWYGYEGTAVGRAIRDAGWRARHVDLAAESVVFERTEASDED